MPDLGDSFGGLPEVNEGGIFTRIAPETPYVWPDVMLAEDSLETPSPVVLIAAPGAMGKSAAAQNIAAALHTVYIDLSTLRVGSSSLTGELAKSLGFSEAADFVKELKAGRAAIILDSTDEAQLGAGRENYVAFLKDLMWLLIDAVPARQVVLLGRRDATDTTLIGLMDLGLTPPLYQIAPLSSLQACELIDLTLDGRRLEGKPYQVHRQHLVPFASFRGQLFRSIAQALEPKAAATEEYWPLVDDFLGYPPVLLALAERLAVENPASEVEEEIPAGLKMLRGQLLQTILESILTREQLKVRERVGDSLGMAPDSVERAVLYGRDEQVSRLLKITGTAGISLDVPASLDEIDRTKYEENIEGFVADHPFLKSSKFANVVFQDYVRAWAVSSTLSGLYSDSRSNFLATLPAAGPFFAHFLHALSVGEDGIGLIPEDLVDDAIRSFALGRDVTYSAYLHRGDAAVLMLHSEVSSEAEDFDLGFEVNELSGVVILRSPLARVSVFTDHALVLRGSEGGLDIGPSVSIAAGEIEIAAKSITTFGPVEGSNRATTWITAGAVTHDADLKVSAVPDGALVIFWPEVWHQWKPFFVDLSSRDKRVTQATVSQVLLCLRRVFTSFRPSVQDDLSMSADKMDRVVIGSNPVFLATISALDTLGVVSRDGALFRVHLDALAKYEIAWMDLRGDDPVSPLKTILEAVVATSDFDTFKS